MAESEYHVIELVGTSSESWEKAAEAAVRTASKLLRDTRVAKVVRLDVQFDDHGDPAFRVRLQVSFKYHMIFSLTPKFHRHLKHW